MRAAKGLISRLVVLCAIVVVGACGAQGSAQPGATTVSDSDVAAAQKAALTLFVEAGPGFWVACPSADRYSACPLSPAVRDRLYVLQTTNYFYSGPGGRCAGDFISNSTNGLQQEPKVVSSTTDAQGRVTVVIDRGATQYGELTAVMARQNGAWVVIDLTQGAGGSASIFAASPNC